MVIDTSAFLAILQDEPDRRSFTEAIGAAVVRRTSAATFLEASMVLQSRHPAGLDYGDCFAYALARQLGEPLLCKGGDFARTDIDLVLPPAPTP